MNTDIKPIKNLHKKDIKSVACNNGLSAYDIKEENIIEFVDVIPGGVLELVKGKIKDVPI